MSDEAACSAKDNPATTGGRVVLIISLPRNYAHARAVAGAVSNIEEALQCADSRSAAPSNVRCAVLNKEAQLTTMLILASAIAFVGWGVVAPLLPVLPLST